MAMRRLLNYASPRTFTPRRPPSQEGQELLCLVKLLQYLLAAAVVGSIVSILVAIVIGRLMA